MKSFKTHILENKDHVETHFDIMLPKKHDDPKKGKAYVQNLVKKKGGPSVRVTSYDHDGPGGGHPAVSIKGRVDHVMKYHNHHNDEKYSTDHAGHKKMSKDYGFSESVNEKSEFGMAHDIVRKHSKQSEVRGSGDSTTVTAEHPKGQNASKADRAAHTNMLKKKLSHLRGVKVVQKTYPGSATESATNFKEISFRPHDTTSLGTKYANKVGRGDYGSKKIDNRKKGIAMLTKKRMAALGAPTAKVPATK